VNWTPLPDGKHAGKTLPEVMLSDPDFVFRALEAGEFSGDMLDQATEVCRRATRIWASLDEPRGVTVFYSLHAYYPDHFNGYSVLSKKDSKHRRYAKFSAAQTPYFDLSMPRRIAPSDRDATAVVLGGVKLLHFGDPNAALTREQAERFFSDPKCIAE
jgi:hypothetical protein